MIKPRQEGETWPYGLVFYIERERWSGLYVHGWWGITGVRWNRTHRCMALPPQWRWK